MGCPPYDFNDVDNEKRIDELEEGIEELLCNFSHNLPPNVIEGLNKLLGKKQGKV